MPIIQIPLLEELRKEQASGSGNGNQTPPAQASLFPPPSSPPLDDRLHKMPFGLLDDDLELQLERSRLREAFWVSLVAHGVLLALVVWLMPKLMVNHKMVPNRLAQVLEDHNLTFLSAAPAPHEKPPDTTNKISDQDRRAALRHPDLQTLRELEEARRAGAPGAIQAPRNQQQQPSPQNQATAQNQGQNNQQGQQTQANDQVAKLEQPQMPRSRGGANNPFATPSSPGSVIEEAARASAGRHTITGSSGEYGIGPAAQPTKLRSDVDILSDTMGVDFGPYLARVLETLRQNWYNLIPEEARAPLMKSGKVSIDFAIRKDGSVAGMHIASPSGDVALDRAAWGGITDSNPFQPLPQQFRGDYLALRIHFFYNPQRSDLQ